MPKIRVGILNLFYALYGKILDSISTWSSQLPIEMLHNDAEHNSHCDQYCTAYVKTFFSPIGYTHQILNMEKNCLQSKNKEDKNHCYTLTFKKIKVIHIQTSWEKYKHNTSINIKKHTLVRIIQWDAKWKIYKSITDTVHLIQVLQGKTNCKGLTIAMLAKKKLKITSTGRFA